MKLKELRENYQNATTRASDLARSTNYSLIAIVWILCGQNLDTMGDYNRILFFLVLSLAADYLQYLIRSLVMGCIYAMRELKVTTNGNVNDDAEVKDYPEFLRWTTWILYITKYIFTLLAVSFLASKLYKITF